jgi:integrase
MKTSSFLKLSRHNIYIFRRRIPKALADLFKTNELRITTKTSDKKIALHIARNIANETDLLFERLKNNKIMDDKKDFTGLMKELDHWQARNRLRTQLDEESDLRTQEMIENRRQIKELEATHLSALNQQEKGYKLALDAVTGLVTEKLANSANPPKTDFKLSELVDDCFSIDSFATRGNALATIRKNRDSLKLFIDIIGDKFISDLKQPDAVIFAKACPLYGRKDGKKRAVSTINGYMDSVSKFSSWVSSIHSETAHIKLDFSRLKYKRTKRASEERELFTDDDVDRIFNHSEFSSFKDEDPAKYWLIYISAYTGARLEEISQLSPLNNIYEEKGIWFFDINEEEDRSLKNGQSIRKVPIHSELIRIGILDYVNGLKASGAKVFFPKEKIRDGRIGKNAGKRVARYIQKVVGIKKKSLHCFRHSIATKFKQALLDEGMAAAIMGHEYGGITYNRYGKQYLSEGLKEAMEKIKYEF